MKDFDYLEPTSVREACSMLSQHGDGAKVMAGGVALMTLLKQKLIQPGCIVSLEKIPALNYINYDDGTGLRLGATTPHRAIENSRLVAEKYPLLSQMAHHIGSIQVRNLGTIGGNLCHAEPASDPPAVLVALSAQVKLVSSGGERTVPLEDFFVDFYETVIRPDEVLTEIQIPPLASGTKGAFIKFNPRSAMDLPVIVVAALVVPGRKKGSAKDVKVALGAVTSKPLRASRVEEALKGKELTDEAIQEASQMASEGLEPISDIRGSSGYRKEVAKVLVERALKQAR